MTQPDPPPEVRQCQDEADPNYGAVAVKTDVFGHAWGVFNPNLGGHWEPTNTITATWTVLT